MNLSRHGAELSLLVATNFTNLFRALCSKMAVLLVISYRLPICVSYLPCALQ